ncbi:YoaK family protein [Gordonia humi]|uniref:YoaK family protein n=1 Tax=Gordonia humi TaxID=686429 RepID=UPI0036141438
MQNVRRREWLLAVILSAVAGGLDAIGFLDLGGYFVSFMSGNTTRMSAETVEVGWAVAWHAVGLVGLFFVGAVIGSMIAHIGDGRVTVMAASTALVGGCRPSERSSTRCRSPRCWGSLSRWEF